MSESAKLLLIIGLTFSAVQVGYSQDSLAHIDQNLLCVCFAKGADFITISANEDSSITRFSIIREGYETEEKREEFLRKRQKQILKAEPPMTFYDTYYAMSKPEQISSIDSLSACADVVSLEEYRSDQYTPPKDAKNSLIILIQRLTDNVYLKWKTMLWAQE